jgi:NADPH-dependent F420 reductase
MTVTIIGAGNMGKGLAKRLAAAGEKVALAARDPKKTAEIAHAIGKGVIGTAPYAAASNAEIVIIAVPYPALEEALKETGDLAGKTVVSIVNAVGPNLSMALPNTTSVAEEVQKFLPQAKVVVAFNTLFAPLLDLGYDGVKPPQVFYAGDDAAAKAKVAALIEKLGFEPVDSGPLENARQIEAMANLAIRFGYALGRGTKTAVGVTQY